MKKLLILVFSLAVTTAYGTTLTISGTTSFCYAANLTASYTVTNLTTGTFTWNIPGTCTLVSGAGTNSIVIKFNSPAMGMNISVSNSNGSSGSISVDVYTPAGGTVVGPSSVCAGQTNVVFGIAGSPATNYSWNAGNGVTFVSGANTQNVTVNFSGSYSGGSIGATIINGPCVATATSKTVSIGATLPGTPGAITGSATVAPNQTGVPYSVPAVANATSYQWTLPAGGTIASGGGTNNITVNYSASFSGGSMSVVGSNSVCSGPPSPILTVNPNYLVAPAGPIQGQSSICTTANGGVFQYSVGSILNATSYLWSFDGNVYPPGPQNNLSTISLNFSNANSNTVHISVAGSNSYGNGTYSPTFTVSVSKPVAAAGVINGLSTVCPGQTGVNYQIAALTNATGYSWTVPNGASIVSGSGTNSIMVNFSAGFTGGSFSVTGIGGLCGAGSPSYLSVSLPTLPSAAGTITGPLPICAGASNVKFSVGAIGNASGYTWSVPAGASIVSGANTNTISVNFSASAISGNVSVYGTNCTGNGTNSNFALTVFSGPPSGLGPIQGQPNVCEGGSYPYSVSSIASATSYAWIGTGGPVGFPTGSGTNSVTASFQSNYPTSGATLGVYGVNACGIGPTSNLSVAVYKQPGAASSISGSTTLCPGQNNVPYSVGVISNANGYNWGLPKGLTISSGGNTNSITVNAGASFTGGQILVQGVDGPCGTGPISTLMLSLPTQAPLSPGVITESTVCPNVIYSVPAAMGVNYVWTVPATATIISGGNTNSITVNYSGSATGNVSVYGTNCAGSGPASVKSVTAIPMPDIAGTITGAHSVCPGQNSVSFSVPTINNATGYVWSVPPSAIIASGQNTNTILVNFSMQAASGTISVYGINCGGSGAPSQPYLVSILPIPNTAGPISGKTVVCNQAGVSYSVQPIANASGYQWTVPSGAVITSGQNTPSITVDFTGVTQAGTVSVNGTGCGANGNSSSLPVNTGGGPEVIHSVDLVTGTANASLPLFEVSDGDVSIPISLLYTALGVKVTDDDGWLGHNWNVSAQSYGIFREMRGLPDDYLVSTQADPQYPDNRVGWLNCPVKTNIKNFIPTTDNDPTTCADEVNNYSFLNTLTYDQDTEPDAFHVSLPGLAFDFYFDESNVAQVVPYTDVVITPNATSGPISSFTITDGKGAQYQFNETESLTENLFEASSYYFVRLSNMHLRSFTYNTAWRLTKVISPIYGSLTFTYNPIQSTDNNLVSLEQYRSTPKYSFMALKYVYRYPLITSNQNGAGGTLQYSRSSIMKVLTGIISPSTEAEFVSTAKSSGSVLQRLQTINQYEKRSGARTLARQFNLSYLIFGQRAFLTKVNLKVACVESNYTFDYNLNPPPPDYSSTDKDAWDLFQYQQFVLGMPQYDETAAVGSLRKITQPLNGYTVFFYETHDFWDGSTNVQGGGIRVKKIIQYDAVSSAHDAIQEFSYKAVNGNSSGKLQHKNALSFSVVKQPFWQTVYRYREMQQQYPTAPASQINDMFTVTGTQDLSHPNELNGSAVAYSRVTVKTTDVGTSIYEYDLPASYQETSANNNEWTASKVMIARPSTGTSACYDNTNINEGYYRYPFPVNPPYNYARGLLTKVTDFNVTGATVRDVVNSYQRVYKSSAINKVYGLALEELPTYYYNGSAYLDAKMFLYSRYELYTNVKTELSQQTETIYNSNDLTSKTQVVTSYYFDSPAHRQLSRTVTQHSDGTTLVSRTKYAQDFYCASPTEPLSTALKGLNDAHRVAIPVETTTSKIINGTEEYLGADLTLFQTLNASKIYPYQQYHYVSNDGNGGYTPSSIVGNAFTFDNTHYVLGNTFVDFDSYGNPATTRDGSQDVQATAYGYNGTVPVIQVSHAGLGEIKYSDFESTTPADFFITWGAPTYGVGMNSPRSLNIPAGSASSNFLTNGIAYNRSPWYIFSGWVNAATGGTLTLQVAGNTYTYNFSGSSGWSYCRMRLPITGVTSNFTVTIWSSTSAELDDLALYPEQADFKAYTYQLPFGKASEKDARGNYRYYDYDASGRLNAIYDRDRNVLKKYDYQVRP